MGKGKPRTATHRKVNKWLESMGPSCEWWDGGYPECNYPWCGKGEKDCQGTPFVCKKLLYRYLASSNKISQVVRSYLWHIENNNKNNYMNIDILPEPFCTAFETGSSIDYRVDPKSGTSDHKYIEKFGYHSEMRSDCSYTADGLPSFSLSSYGNWGCFYPKRASNEEKQMFLDMCEKDIIHPWRIRTYIDNYMYDYSTEKGWSRYNMTEHYREDCDNPYVK